MEQEIRKVARELLREGKVDLVIGHGRGTLPLRSTPCFIADEGGADELIWDPSCGVNLARYLPDFKRRVGIVAKGCDARSIVVLINEGQVERENVQVIGVPCRGVVDRRKMERELGSLNGLEITYTEDAIKIKGKGSERELPLKEYLCEGCVSCRSRNPPIHDVLVGEFYPEDSGGDEYARIREIESMPAEERWRLFEEELGRCIRCYACREACPLCYCKECFVDETMPQWFGKTTDLSDTIIFHLVRALHLTGRCVDCGACTRACPMEIDLRSLTKKTEKIVEERFGQEYGFSLGETPVMGTFKQDDPQEFVVKGGKEGSQR
jgi:formate dehydrogenase subunit beta